MRGQEVQEKEAAQRFAQSVETQKEAVRRQYEGTAMWMKAPNGKDTNLTEEQWLLVRTPAFKAWFGDWEAEAERTRMMEMKGIPAVSHTIYADTGAKARNLAREKFKEEYPKGFYVQKSIGNIKVDDRSLKDSFGHGVGQKKLDVVMSLVVMSLEEGMKQSVYVGPVDDFDGKNTINHFFVYKVLYKSEGEKEEENYVICRVREDYGNFRLYIHEVGTLKELKEKSDALQTRPTAPKERLQPRGVALYTFILQKFLSPVNTASKIVDENGER